MTYYINAYQIPNSSYRWLGSALDSKRLSDQLLTLHGKSALYRLRVKLKDVAA